MRSPGGEMRRAVLRVAGSAWDSPDRFRWFSDYMDLHGLRTVVRVAIAATTLVTSCIPIINMASPDGADGIPQHVTAIVSCLGGLCLAAFWLAAPWPGPRQSIGFIIAADLFITLGLFSDSRSIAGLSGATVFAVVGGYSAFFHGTRVLCAHIAWTVVVCVSLATLAGLEGDPAMGVSKGIVVVLANVVIPMTSQILLSMLSSDSVESRRDPLTRLPNRRGLDQALAAVGRFTPHCPDDVVVVTVIDLDAFKRVNDARGHECGDLVLAETGRRLAASIGADDIPCRLGGEEFVVVSQRPLSEVLLMAERIRTAVLAPNQGLRVTASVGVAWAGAATMADMSASTLVEDLLRTADRAMYDAKRAGGNRVRMQTDPPDTDESRVG